MTIKRFEIVKKEKGKYDNGISIEDTVIGINHQMLDEGSAKDVCILLNELSDESEQLKKALLFFYDVANCECSTNWKEDMEKGCKRFFNCTYEEAREKYGEYDGMWWEIND